MTQPNSETSPGNAPRDARTYVTGREAAIDAARDPHLAAGQDASRAQPAPRRLMPGHPDYLHQLECELAAESTLQGLADEAPRGKKNTPTKE